MIDSEFMFQYWLVAHFDHAYSYGNFIDVENLEVSPQQHIEFVICGGAFLPFGRVLRGIEKS